MSAIKKFVDNEWRIFSATDAVNISTVFPGYRSTTDSVYQPSTTYYWCYRSDKKLTTDISKMTPKVTYKIGETVGRVYFRNDETGEYEPYNIDPECVLVNSHYSVHDVLLKHDEEIQLLKRNVSWLALHGGGGSGGGGGGGSSTSKAKCTIYVNDKLSVGSSGYVVTKTGSSIKIDLRDFNIETNKKWKVNVYSDTSLITSKEVSYTAPSFSIAYTYIEPYVVNHKVPNFIVQASYEDDESSIYGYSEWIGNLVDATVGLETESTYKINFNFRNQTQISYTYSTGITHQESEGIQIPLNYTLSINIKSDSLDNPTTYTKTFTIETGSGKYSTDFCEMLENSSNPVKKEDQKPGSYELTATLTSELDGQIISSEEVVSAVALISETAVYVSKYLSTLRDYPTTFSSDSKLNTKYILYKNNQTSFNASYYVGIMNDITKEFTQIAILAENITEKVGEIISYAFSTATWKSDYVGTDQVLCVKNVLDVGEEHLVIYNYFKISQGNDNYLNYSQDGELQKFVDFRVDEYGTDTTPEQETIKLVPVKNWTKNGNKVNGVLTIPNKNNKTWIVEDSVTGQPSLRISNGVYAYFKEFKADNADANQTFAETIQNSIAKHEWTVSICYKADYHPDDDRTVLSCGTYSEDDNSLITGFAINVHDIYIGTTKVARLTDSTVNTVDITCRLANTKDTTGEIGGKAYVIKVYVNGVLTAITTDNADGGKIKLGDEIYIGGRPQKLYSNNQYLCDCNIYTIRLFTSPLSDLDILSNYINNKIITSYYKVADSSTVDGTIRDSESDKNLCTTDTTSNTLKCDIYNSESGYSISSFLDTDGLLDAAKIGTTQAPKLGIPIVLIDVAHNTSTGWTFDNYHTVYTKDSESQLNETSALCQYWTGGSNVIQFEVTVGIQGTSSLEYPTKNLDITLKEGDFFIPKAEWLPEQTYTIKVDMMDSAHSNNASVGKMINEVLGYDKDGNCKFFPASDKAVSAVYNTQRTVEGTLYDYHKNQQPLATLKHTVEGYPIFLIMRFLKEDGKQTIPIGIGSFNLGRKALRNLGFKSLTYIKNKEGVLEPDSRSGSVSYPLLISDAEYSEVYSDCEWIETKTLHNNLGMSAIDTTSASKENGYPETYEYVDPQSGKKEEKYCKYDADFWQSQADIIKNYAFEVQYQYNNKSGETSIMNDDFVNFNGTISMLPIEALQYSQVKNTERNSYLKGKYRRLKYNTAGETEEDPDNPYIEVELDQNKYVVDTFKFDYDKCYYYFVIAMLFGLVDNFGKNVSYRRWNDISQSGSEEDKGKYYPDFYDLDTCLGLSNTGKETVEPDVWLKYIDNSKEENADYGYAKECYFEDKSTHTQTESSSNNVVSSFDNKLWLTIDSQFFRTLIGADSSRYSLRWCELRNNLDKYVATYNSEHDTNYDGFVDFFVDEFFAKQTGSCGSLIFNYDYRLKYLMQFEPTDENISEKFCVYIHGRRIDYVRQWLKNHVLFLDTIFQWRDPTPFNNPSLTFKSNINSFVKFTVNGAQQEGYPLTTNAPLIVNSTVANNINTFYWMKKNTKTYTNTIFNTNSPISVIYYNSPNFINIGDDSIPLSYLKVNEMMYSSTYYLDNPGLPALTDLNFSTATSFTSNFSTEIFATGDVSELRTVDFSATKNSKTWFGLDFATSGKFTKLTDIDISDSCITQLYLPDTPLLTLKVANSPINNFSLTNQRYLKDISFEGCTNLQTISIKSCYSYDKVILDKANNLKSVVISDCHNIKTIELTNCPVLTTVQITDCPNLEVIKINDAVNLGNESGDTGLTIGNIGKLVELNLHGCTKLKYIHIQKMDSGEGLRTLDISETSVGYISGRCDGVNFETEYNGCAVLDLSQFVNLTYNPSPLRKDSGNRNITEYFACYWNDAIEQIKFANKEDKPIKITQPFRSCDNLIRTYGCITLAANPSMKAKNGDTYNGLFNSCTGYSIHGHASSWKGQSVKSNGVYKTSWEILGTTRSQFDNLTESDAFVKTDTTNTGHVTNLKFSNAGGIYIRTFLNTDCDQFDFYYTMMMIALSDCTANVAGGLWGTFANCNTMLNWATSGSNSNSWNKNQPSINTFYRLNDKVSYIYQVASTGYTYLKSPDIGHYYDSYESDGYYNAGDIVVYNEKLYRCRSNTTKGQVPTNTGYWLQIISYSASTTYYNGDYAIKDNKVYVSKITQKGSFNSDKWKLVEVGDTFVAKDNGVFSPIPNVILDRPFSGSAIFSKWLFRRLDGKYNHSSGIHLYEKLIVDTDCGRIYDDNGEYIGYVNFMDATIYSPLDKWSAEVLPISSSDRDRIAKTKCCGNYDNFFDDFSVIPSITGFNGYCINFNTLVIPTIVSTIGNEGSGGAAMDHTIARGTIDFTKIFPVGNNIIKLAQAFEISGYNDSYKYDDMDPKAHMPIRRDMFSTMNSLLYYGYYSQSGYNHALCFVGNGIKKYIPEGTSIPEWDEIQEHLFDNIAPRILTLSCLFQGLEDARLTSKLPFPGKLFKKCTKLQSVHNFMKDCQQPYYLTPEGFINCTQLQSVYQMCYWTTSPSTAPNTNSNLYGEIPYKFFYHGFSDNAVNVYGSDNKDKPATIRQSGSLENFASYTIKYDSGSLVKGDHTIRFNKNGIWLDNVTTKYISYISVINCCNMTIGETVYNGTAVVKVSKVKSTDEFYSKAVVTITTNKKNEDTGDYDKVTVTLNYDLDDTVNEIFVTNACQVHSNDIINVNRSIIDMYQCFYGCNNITQYQYDTQTSTVVSKTKKNPDGSYKELDKPFTIKVKNSSGEIVDKEVGRLEVNPEYNPYKWIYNSNTDSWEENTSSLTKYEYCGYWSYNGNTEQILLKSDTNYSVLADNSRVFNTNAFIETFDIVQIPKSLDAKPTNCLNYCCAPDFFRYTKDLNSINVKEIFLNCGCYGATIAKGMQGRICSYLLKPISTITDLTGLFRNCRRLSSYKYGKEVWKSTGDTVYEDNKEYYRYIKGLPTLMESFTDYAVGDLISNIITAKKTVGTNQIYDDSGITKDKTYQSGKTYYYLNDSGDKKTLVANTDYIVEDDVGNLIDTKDTIEPEEVREYEVQYENDYIYQIPDTFFNYTLKVETLVGTFSGLIFLYNTKLDIFGNISATLANICSVYSACHYVTYSTLDQWIISATFNTLKASRASGCFALAYLGYNNDKQYYVEDPINGSTTTIYYGDYLSKDATSTNFPTPPGAKLKFLNNFNASRMGDAVKKAKYNWWGSSSELSISEASGVDVSKNS